jgi:predicted Zn-dependent protease
MHLPKKLAVAFLVTLISVSIVSSTYAFSLSHAYLTPKEEGELGDKLMLYVKEHYEFIRDPFIVDYVNRVGQQIVRQLPNPPFAFHFYVLKEDVYNAFAGPGGHVFVNSGLLEAMENEEALAGILAHEISHVLCRHISEQIDRAKKISLATAAGVLAGIFLGGGSDAAGAAMAGSAALGQSVALKYSRENEREADEVGIKYLTKAGYGCEGLLEILLKMRNKRWFGPEQMPTYLSTHPALESRLAYLDTWIQTHPQEARSVRSVDPSDFQKAQTRLIALYGEVETARETFDTKIRDNPEDAFAYYGKALLLDRENQEKGALEYLKEALHRRPLDPDIYRDLGKSYFHIGDYSNALKTLKGVLAYRPRDPEGWFLVGRAQMETGDLQGAVDSFKALLEIAPNDLPGMYYLGDAYGRLGDLAEAHYYLGTYYKAKGDFENARFHLTRALSLEAKDSERKKAIEEALRALSEPQQRDHNAKNAW